MTLAKCSKALFFGIDVSLAMLAVGCGGGSSGGGGIPPTVSVIVSPTTASVPVGGTQQFTATVTGTTNTLVTWTVNDVVGGNPTVGTISNIGLYTAPNAIPSPSTVSVKAASQADSTKSASATVTITAPAVGLMSLSPIVAMQNSQAFTLTANGSGFTPNSQIVFNGTAKATTLVGSTQLTAPIPSTDIAAPGTFPVLVQTNGEKSGALDFYIVPALQMTPVPVFAGALKPPVFLVNIAVQQVSPSTALSVIAVGLVNEAGSTGVTVKRGDTANLFLVGTGIKPGTFYSVSGNPSDVSVTQPVVADFSQTTDGTPAVNVRVSVSPSAALSARDILVTNPAGEISVFVGGLQID